MNLLRRYLSLVFLVVCLLATHAETITGKVVSVADGDTITVLQGEEPVKIRFHGVDTPEKSQDFGQAAKQFTADRCFGEMVTVTVTDTDRYGRKVGLVILKDGRVLNHELVAAGMAHWYEHYAPGDLTLKYLEADARAAKRGLWSRPDVITPHEFRQGKRPGNRPPYNPPGSMEGAKAPTPTGEHDGTVYITDSGTKYHKAGCRFLKQSKEALPLATAKQRYEPCGVCNPQ